MRERWEKRSSRQGGSQVGEGKRKCGKNKRKGALTQAWERMGGAALQGPEKPCCALAAMENPRGSFTRDTVYCAFLTFPVELWGVGKQVT